MFRAAAHLAGHWKEPPGGVGEIVIEDNAKKEWFVYILRCGNGALYTGVTTDVQRRLGEHSGNGRLSARFTRAFGPVELAYSCRVGEKSLAYRVEHRIKRLAREKKDLIVSRNLSIGKLIAFLKLLKQSPDGGHETAAG
jgi:putative endonuclease